jgi:hypothetical protein
MPERVVALTGEISEIANSSISEIFGVTRLTKLLAVNAQIEAARAGEAGRGFNIVAQEVGLVSERINEVSRQLTENLDRRLKDLHSLGSQLVSQVRGSRLADLSLNMIEIIDRNLYERSCDVRWWATDSAVVDCLQTRQPELAAFASRRLGVILDAYTVYLDLWVADREGTVVASGRPSKYRQVVGSNVRNAAWFTKAMQTSDGGDFAVVDIAKEPLLENRAVAAYSTAIREGGDARGRALGALGIFFNWEEQARAVVEGVRLAPDEKEKTRCLLLDSKFQVIASSPAQGILSEKFPLHIQSGMQTMGSYSETDGTVVGYALTPGYETYRGLGWFGVITQKR